MRRFVGGIRKPGTGAAATGMMLTFCTHMFTLLASRMFCDPATSWLNGTGTARLRHPTAFADRGRGRCSDSR
jgi:hypothetical protein